jgi:hypothetical protein
MIMMPVIQTAIASHGPEKRVENSTSQALYTVNGHSVTVTVTVDGHGRVPVPV